MSFKSNQMSELACMIALSGFQSKLVSELINLQIEHINSMADATARELDAFTEQVINRFSDERTLDERLDELTEAVTRIINEQEKKS